MEVLQANIVENNGAEELETPKIPKKKPKYFTIEESVRLLIECKDFPRDHLIITMLLNCALRLPELISIDISDVNGYTLHIIGNGNKERVIFLTPTIKKLLTIG